MHTTWCLCGSPLTTSRCVCVCEGERVCACEYAISYIYVWIHIHHLPPNPHQHTLMHIVRSAHHPSQDQPAPPNVDARYPANSQTPTAEVDACPAEHRPRCVWCMSVSGSVWCVCVCSIALHSFINILTHTQALCRWIGSQWRQI
jgi:hypothetical protein